MRPRLPLVSLGRLLCHGHDVSFLCHVYLGHGHGHALYAENGHDSWKNVNAV